MISILSEFKLYIVLHPSDEYTVDRAVLVFVKFCFVTVFKGLVLTFNEKLMRSGVGGDDIASSATIAQFVNTLNGSSMKRKGSEWKVLVRFHILKCFVRRQTQVVRHQKF
jgi:hypothetical protein